MSRYDDERENRAAAQARKLKRRIGLGVGGFAALLLAFMTFYIVPEGHVTVVKFTGKADRMEQPGFHVKTPFLETTETFEVRERKNVEEMAAATANQLPATATVSMNWTVNKTAAMDLFIKYGGLEQFEERVLDPRMRSAAKAAIARFRADEIIREREKVVAEIHNELRDVAENLPINVSNVQLENVLLPKQYMESILAKEKAREDAEREKHKLAQQKLQAQQQVQTAEATRDSNKALADGNAYRTLTEAQAEAKAIKLINAELAKSPTYVDLVRAKAWDGKLPTTVLGEGATPLVPLGNVSTSIK